jgi:homoserine kinase type II
MAVYTEVPTPELEAFVAARGLGEVLGIKGIAEGVENSNFLVETAAGPFILTVYEKRVDPGDLPFFLGLMRHLAGRGINCPLPVETADVPALGMLAGKPAAMVTFLKGVWPRDIGIQHCAALGRELARLHAAGQGFEIRRANALGVDGWRPLFEKFSARADEITPRLGAAIVAALDQLEARWPHDLPHGVIHADLFPDNVFFRGERLSGLIDFYFACNDLLAYDLAVCLNAWCFDQSHRYVPARGQALLSAYHAERPLTAAEIAALPCLAQGAALRFLLTRAYDWIHTPPDALVTRKDPLEYLAKLAFHQDVTTVEGYGWTGGVA